MRCTGASHSRRQRTGGDVGWRSGMAGHPLCRSQGAPHQCLGQSLVRVQVQVALETLLRRLPGLRLIVPFEELRFNEVGAVYGLPELPVAW